MGVGAGLERESLDPSRDHAVQEADQSGGYIKKEAGSRAASVPPVQAEGGCVMWEELWEELRWYCCDRWVYARKLKRMTREQQAKEVFDSWEKFLATVKDEPADRTLHDAMEAMIDLKKSFEGKGEGVGE